MLFTLEECEVRIDELEMFLADHLLCANGFEDIHCEVAALHVLRDIYRLIEEGEMYLDDDGGLHAKRTTEDA